MSRTSFTFLTAVLAALLYLVPRAHAQQQIGYVDSDYLLEQIPEAAAAEQRVDRLAADWEAEIAEQEAAAEALEQEFQARELLYTDEERETRRAAVEEARAEVQALRQRYFGPEGQLFEQRQQLLRPIQERVLTAVETVAQNEGYDYVLDKSSAFVLMYARDAYDLNEEVLQELGIDIDASE